MGLGVLLSGTALHAESLTIAVAANFLNPLQALKAEFEGSMGHEITVVGGSTGQLYAQIINGAPFDVLLAADTERPRLLAAEGWGDPSSRFTYAFGRLVLWSFEDIDESTLERLAEQDFHWLAIANPDLAPYGAAAKQVLETLGVWASVSNRIVRGGNIGQAFAFVETGNAQLGLVALSQALAYRHKASFVIVRQELHDPIRQDAILLRRAGDNSAAHDFMRFLETPLAATIIERYGYVSADPRD